jgi:hypothetical protein
VSLRRRYLALGGRVADQDDGVRRIRVLERLTAARDLDDRLHGADALVRVALLDEVDRERDGTYQRADEHQRVVAQVAPREVGPLLRATD